MIKDCFAFLKEKLTAADAGEFYEQDSDASRFKGVKYVLAAAVEQIEMTYDGGKVAYFDDLAQGIRTYHIRKYAVKIVVVLRFADKDRDGAEAARAGFLRILGTGFADTMDYRIEVEATAGNILKDPSVLSGEAGTEATVLFTGGVYATKQVRLLGSIEPEGKITIKEGIVNGTDANAKGGGGDAGSEAC